ncbi:von Willebrand factor A domain-containing protein 7-like [Hoplias malabaricus]|uniref:von Willebrand factor A domain-containing protein 7-like n=1 Tax=Hoplias malabaricus TaxID=27720 RepID=UPI00346364F6
MAFLLLFLYSLVVCSQAFLPSFPLGDEDSRTHYDITEEALLSVALDACREEAQAVNRPFNPPSLMSPEAVLTACLGASDDAEVSASVFTILLNEIISENSNVDRDQAFSSAHHFNDEIFGAGRNVITQGLAIVRANLQQNNLEAARRALGAVTHTLQDFYSHSNWFELGNQGPNTNLLQPDIPLQNVADSSTPTCKNCEEKECPNVILPEILSKDTLTSGYLLTAPPGKCNHGSRDRGGISKDFGGGALAPDGTDPHLAAFNAAKQATVDLLQNIRIAFQNRLFLRMLGINRSAVVCFVVDTTGSMTDDIVEVRRLIREIIDIKIGTPDEPSLYILVEFNDPKVGPVTTTTDPEEMKQKVDSIRVAGGGDIPELSLSGLELALNTAPPFSSIFLFTDAPPKDKELLGTVTSLIQTTQSSVIFLLSESPIRHVRNPQNTRRRRAVTNPNNVIYQQLAQASGGQAIEVTKNQLSQATAVVLDSITSSLVTLLQVDSTRPDTFSFLVDPRVQNVTLYITGESVNFTMQNPAGVSQGNAAGSGPLASVFPVGNLYRIPLNEGNQMGRWQISISSPQAYSLKITGRSMLSFFSRFVELFDGPHPGFTEITARPPAGQNSTLLITVTGVQMLFEVRLGLVGVSGKVLRNASVTRLREGTYLASVPLLPNIPFTLLLSGQEMDGRSFQRQSTTQIQASQITVQVQRTVILPPGESTSVLFTVETQGIEGVIRIEARDDQRFVTSFTNSLNIGPTGNATGSVTLLVPTETRSGSTSIITIRAESTPTSQSNFALLRVSVIQRDIDITPPVCRVVNESLDCPALCENANWTVTLLMTDGNGTGLQDPRVSIRVPGTPFNESFVSTVDSVLDENGFNVTLLTIVASCCAANVEISAVDKEGNVGRCDFSIRRPSTTEATRTTSSINTTFSIRTTSSHSPRVALSLWTTLLLTLSALLL